MKKIAFFMVLVLALSCRKGELAPEHYQAGIVINSSQLSTVALEVRFDGAATGDSMSAGASIEKIYDLKGGSVKDGLPTRFRVYKAGTQQLVADTSFLLRKDQRPSFNVIFNDELGLGGFVNQTGVASDSVRIRVIYHDQTSAKKFSKLEWQFYQYADLYPYVDTVNNVQIILPLNENQYSSDFQIPIYRLDGATTTHLFARIKDPVTGAYLLWFPDVPAFEAHMDAADLGGGNYYFFNLNLLDNYSDGGVDYYQVDYNYLKL